MIHPYSGLEAYQFWSRSMSSVWHSDVDVVTVGASISSSERISTMGSCFAQHLARHIGKSGLNYFVPERAPASMSEVDAIAENYGVYSARYGNIYTAAQAVQLFDRAFGRFDPVDSVWEKEGKYVDAFRPQITPRGFDSPDQVKQARDSHLGHVRTIFTESDWIIFTLGLTEGWRSRQDGAVYPIAPGVAGGAYDPSRYEFVNFTSSEIVLSLRRFMQNLGDVNPRCRVLFTVSPVPLIATYENRHVWVSTTLSKAALRVAVDEIERTFDNAIYFPSYEVITSPAAAGRYYHNDLRQVTDVGVSHVMRLFDRYFLGTPQHRISTPLSAHVVSSVALSNGIICDEELIEKALCNAAII